MTTRLHSSLRSKANLQSFNVLLSAICRTSFGVSGFCSFVTFLFTHLWAIDLTPFEVRDSLRRFSDVSLDSSSHCRLFQFQNRSSFYKFFTCANE